MSLSPTVQHSWHTSHDFDARDPLWASGVQLLAAFPAYLYVHSLQLDL